MRGRRLEADPRFTFHASRFTVLGSGPRTTQMVADRSPQETTSSREQGEDGAPGLQACSDTWR